MSDISTGGGRADSSDVAVVATSPVTESMTTRRAGHAVAAGAVMLAFTAPGQTTVVSVFVDPMIDGLSLDRAAVSTAYLLGTLAGAAGLVAAGVLIDRWGIQRSLILIAAAFGTALAGMAAVRGMVALAVGFAAIRWLGAGALNLLSTTAVSVWVGRRRGTAIGVATAVGAAGISAAPLLLDHVIGRVGWRWAWLACAVVVWLVLLPLGFRGLPTAASADRTPGSGHTVLLGPTAVGQHGRRGRSAALLWVLCGAAGVSSLTGTALVFHQTSLLTAQGLSATTAAATFLPQTAAALLGAALAGRLADRIAPLLLVAPAMALTLASLVLVQRAAPGWPVLVYAVVLGLSVGAIRTVEAAAVPHYFGTAQVGRLRGRTLTATVAAAALGPLPLAWAHTHTGSYTPALTALMIPPAIVAVASIMLAGAVRRPRRAGVMATIEE